MNLIRLICLMCILLCFFSCRTNKVGVVSTGTSKPNIVWIVCEDISPTLSMYGDSSAFTPNLDALAAESTIYDNAFATVGVCAPARSSIITGMYPTSIGTMHMRTGKDVHSHGKRIYERNTGIQDIEGGDVIQYSAVLPTEVKCFTEYLREKGYYCTNNAKTDYQFAAPLSAWDENGNTAHWKNTPNGKPFFSVFNSNLTHESKLWKHEDKPLTVKVSKDYVPPYLPNTREMRETINRHYSNVELMDVFVGDIIKQLKDDGLYEDAIIFFFSDHGGPLPRQKREAYDSGLKVPLMIKYPNSKKPYRDNQLISFVDLAPTVLEIASVEKPKYLQGFSFLDKHKRKYVYGSGDRFDEHTDRVRIIRTDRFLYVKNYFPKKKGYKHLKYRMNIPGMRQFLSMAGRGSLKEEQARWFEQKSDEELYEVSRGTHNIYNLADDSRYQNILDQHRGILQDHQNEYGDLGAIPEAKMISTMWPNNIQPITKAPSLIIEHNMIFADCPTPGASISYLISEKQITTLNLDAKWQLYTRPIPIEKGVFVTFVAERIGYATSELINYSNK